MVSTKVQLQGGQRASQTCAAQTSSRTTTLPAGSKAPFVCSELKKWLPDWAASKPEPEPTGEAPGGAASPPTFEPAGEAPGGDRSDAS